MPRKVLLLITDLQIGGTPTVVRELARRLHDPPNVEIQVASLAPRGPVANEIESFGVRTTSLNARGRADIGSIFRLRKFIRRECFDTVFSFLVHANVAASVSSPRTVRKIQSIQTTQPHPRWYWTAQRFAHPAAEIIVVPSKSAAEAAVAWSHIPPGKIAIIPNAVEPAEFANLQRPAPDDSKSTADSSSPDDALSADANHRFSVACIGRLDPIKNVPDVVAAVARLDGRYQLHIYGDGADRPRVEAAIASHGVRSRVTLHGAIPHPQIALASAEILVLASSAEGFGLVLIEAMAAGVPVVATAAPGIRDVVEDGRNGLLVPIGNPAAIAAAIERIANDPALARQLVRNGLADATTRYSWPPIIAAYRKILDLPTMPII